MSTSAFAQERPDSARGPDDPYLWLENVEGDSALAWVENQNERTLDTLQASPRYDGLYERSLEIISSDARIAYPSIRGEHLYNFWTDDAHERGIWRRTTLDSYLTEAPEWETLLDIDALSEEEGVNWTYKGATCRPPAYTRCLVRLSRGGADAVEIREFDTETASFVEDGFFLPEAKSSVAWVSADTLLVSTDWGEGTLTTSGYPRIVKRWVRGDALSAAETVFEAEADDMGAWAGSFHDAGRTVPLVVHRPSFFEGTYYVARSGAEPEALSIPADADPSLVSGQLVVYLRSEWETGGTTYPQGALIATGFDAFLSGEADFETVLAPDERMTIESTSATKNDLLVSVLEDVRGALYRYRYEGGAWTGERVEAPDLGSVNVVTTGEDDDRFFFAYSSFLQPTTLYFSESDNSTPRAVKQLPEMFDAEGLAVEQFEATSDDGTQVPYFVVHREDLARDGSHPALLYGYGGFEIALTPSYSALTGTWLEDGGVYVVANIRGGGEFGPEWHRAAQKENRQRAYDDFLAVGEDLVARGITSPEHLGIRGGSNGGLLVGVALTQRPDLFGAAVVQVPLLDMLRYHKLLAGASWMAEYGDPDDPEERAYIAEYSPYQNVEEDADYPRVLFTTTTRDDRVHPGHARKMAAKMEAMGHPVLYFENTEGGHGSGVTPEQQATLWALVYSYLWDQLQ